MKEGPGARKMPPVLFGSFFCEEEICPLMFLIRIKKCMVLFRNLFHSHGVPCSCGRPEALNSCKFRPNIKCEFELI